MMKTTRRQLVENPFASVTEGSVPEIVPQRYGFGQILVQGQGTRNCPGNLRDLQGMSQAGPIVIPLGREEYLGFILQASKCLAVQDTVAIHLENRAHRAGLFLDSPPPGGIARTGMPGKHLHFTLFKKLADFHIL